MAALKTEILNAVDRMVRIVYVDSATAKWWNDRSKPGELRQFCGFYWVRQHEEAGPFKTYSAAARDAHYRFVARCDPPEIGYNLVYGNSEPLQKKKRA